MNTYSKFLALVGGLTLVGLAPTRCVAATNEFLVPPFRGAENSQAGIWESFSVPLGAPGNFADQAGASTGAVLVQANAGAVVTGSGNLYHPGLSSFRLSDATPFVVGTVLLQTRTIGGELNYDSVILVYTNETGSHQVRPSFSYELSRTSVPGQGNAVSRLWQWDVTRLGVSNYSVEFGSISAHSSLDAVALDTSAQFNLAFAEQPFVIEAVPAEISRWMYPFNANPASRPTASVFGSLGTTPRFDSRNGQFLLGWDTKQRSPAGRGAANYIIKRVRVTLTIAGGDQYVYSGTLRDYRSYFPTNDPHYMAPNDYSSPVELFGAGFRAGYTSTTFPQDAPWTTNTGSYYGCRTAYAAGYNRRGVLVDVSNNVGDDGTNEIAAPFEVAPFAVGQSTNVAPGERMPQGSQLTFELNLADPLVYAYVQNALNEGRLNLVATCLVDSSFSGPPNYPSFYTAFSAIASPQEYPLLDIEGAIVRAAIDGDADGLPDDWENYYFQSLRYGADADPDEDGVSNLGEYQSGTVPNSGGDQLRIRSIEMKGLEAQVQFDFRPNRLYDLEWSNDLRSWEKAAESEAFYTSNWLEKSTANPTYPAPVYGLWRDRNAQGEQRFYRIRSE